MTMTSLAPSGPANLDALEAFMEFPTSLARLDTAGRVERVNLAFRARLGDDQPAEAALRALAQNPEGAWCSVRLGSKGKTDGKMRPRAIRTSNRILLILDDQGGTGRGSHLDVLLARITDLERLAATDPGCRFAGKSPATLAFIEEFVNKAN
jgi:hypothetical protein